MRYLNYEIARATKSRHDQKSGWRKHVDDSINW
jgi:hypothetical protein